MSIFKKLQEVLQGKTISPTIDNVELISKVELTDEQYANLKQLGEVEKQRKEIERQAWRRRVLAEKLLKDGFSWAAAKGANGFEEFDFKSSIWLCELGYMSYFKNAEDLAEECIKVLQKDKTLQKELKRSCGVRNMHINTHQNKIIFAVKSL